MTVSSELNRKQYAGNGVTTSFATSPVVFFDTSDLVVYVVTTATGASTTLTENTHYTVSGGDGSTGTVSLAGGSNPYGAPSASQTVVLVRDVPLTQAVDFVQNDASDAEVVEDALDKLTMADQQLSARLDRSFTLADSDVSGASLTVPTPSANKLVGWNSAATALENKTPADIDLATVTAFVETLLDDATAGALIETIRGGLTADTAPAIDDEIITRDTTNTTGKRMTLENVFKVINGVSRDSVPVGSTDYTLSYDASASAAKKILLDDLPLPHMAISGLTYANNGSDATNDIDIAAGSCRDSTDAVNIRLTSALTKRLDAAWAVGTNAGGLDTGSIGDSDYYIWLIKRSDTGVVDALFSLSASAPTMPANYDYKRLIGWFKRVGGTIVAFHTYETEGGGLEQNWDVPTLDINLANTLTTSRRTDAVKVPLDFSTEAHLNVVLQDGGTNAVIWICCPDQTDAAPSASAAPLANFNTETTVTTGVGALRVRTSATGTVAARSTVATIDSYKVVTVGFRWARRN